MIICDVLILGAGASGLMCAIEAGWRGRKTIVIDHRSRAGEKIRISGGGRCNFTNRYIRPESYFSANPGFVYSALARYPIEKIFDFMKTHRIPYEERNDGQWFCRTRASVLADMLVREAMNNGVRFLFNQKVREVYRQDSFVVRTQDQDFIAKSLVIATGGLSYPRLGATDLGYRIARQFHLPVIEPEPALTPMRWRSEDLKDYVRLSGLTLPVELTAGKSVYRGSMLFTHEGLSGPVILQYSLFRKPGEPLKINGFPSKPLYAWFQEGRKTKATIGGGLSRLLPRRFVQCITRDMDPKTPLSQLTRNTQKILCQRIHEWRVFPGGWEGWSKAEVTRGGVDTRALSSKTMECLSVPGLFFIGEVVDVTGSLGGYNLHWAWASGWAAGQYV